MNISTKYFPYLASINQYSYYIILFSVKVSLPPMALTSIVYQYACPLCGVEYVGSTNCTLIVGALVEHGGRSHQIWVLLTCPPHSSLRTHSEQACTPLVSFEYFFILIQLNKMITLVFEYFLVLHHVWIAFQIFLCSLVFLLIIITNQISFIFFNSSKISDLNLIQICEIHLFILFWTSIFLTYFIQVLGVPLKYFKLILSVISQIKYHQIFPVNHKWIFFTAEKSILYVLSLFNRRKPISRPMDSGYRAKIWCYHIDRN